MSNLLDSMDSVLLMGPGPSSINPKVYQALAKPTIGHVDPQFFTVMDGIKDSLQKLMDTKNEATITLSGTGSSGMEAVMTNLIEDGEPMLVAVNGYFSDRMTEVARRLGAQVDIVEFPYGKPVDPSEIEKKLKAKPYKYMSMVHGETSTGVLNPIKEVGKLAKDAGAYFIVDAVTSLGGNEIHVDEWGIDAFTAAARNVLAVLLVYHR